MACNFALKTLMFPVSVMMQKFTAKTMVRPATDGGARVCVGQLARQLARLLCQLSRCRRAPYAAP